MSTFLTSEVISTVGYKLLCSYLSMSLSKSTFLFCFNVISGIYIQLFIKVNTYELSDSLSVSELISKYQVSSFKIATQITTEYTSCFKQTSLFPNPKGV